MHFSLNSVGNSHRSTTPVLSLQRRSQHRVSHALSCHCVTQSVLLCQQWRTHKILSPVLTVDIELKIMVAIFVSARAICVALRKRGLAHARTYRTRNSYLLLISRSKSFQGRSAIFLNSYTKITHGKLTDSQINVLL